MISKSSFQNDVTVCLSGPLPALYCSIQEDTSHKSGQEPRMHPVKKKKEPWLSFYYGKKR